MGRSQGFWFFFLIQLLGSNPQPLLCIDGRGGIWEVWFPELGDGRVFGDGLESGLVVGFISGLVVGFALCLLGGSIGGRGDLTGELCDDFGVVRGDVSSRAWFVSIFVSFPDGIRGGGPLI